MKLVNKQLQVWHYPNIPCQPFKVDVKDELEAYKIYDVLADQHLWLEKNGFIGDYSNSIDIVMFEGNEWVLYYNEYENIEWGEMAKFIESNSTIVK